MTGSWRARISSCCGRSSSSRRGRIIASGGIASIEDVLAVQAIGCAGAIVGSALYEGRFDVGAAMAAVGNAGRRVG